VDNQSNQSGASVLVVDDEANISALLCASLRLSGFEPHSADSAPESYASSHARYRTSSCWM
jgi:DNA-binding NtrC family response regulator